MIEVFKKQFIEEIQSTKDFLINEFKSSDSNRAMTSNHLYLWSNNLDILSGLKFCHEAKDKVLDFQRSLNIDESKKWLLNNQKLISESTATDYIDLRDMGIWFISRPAFEHLDDYSLRYWDWDFDYYGFLSFTERLKVFKDLNICQDLGWEKDYQEFMFQQENFKILITGYVNSIYRDGLDGWLERRTWWPPENWWDDVIAYGAAVYEGKKIEEEVLYPENLKMVDLWRIGPNA